MSQETPTSTPLTVVLVHGAFADASSWSGVIQRLQAAGIQVTAPANPLRGISIDSAYVASMIEQIPGPVLAVGHSYGQLTMSSRESSYSSGSAGSRSGYGRAAGAYRYRHNRCRAST